MPADHFLRKLDAALDLSFVYEITAPVYSKKYGRPPIDPVMLVKYLLVGFLRALPSERQIESRLQTDVAPRWYLGLDLFERVPDHSTISRLRRRKPKFRKTFRRLFEEVVRQCVEKGIGQRAAGSDGLDTRAGQRFAGIGGAGGNDRGTRSVLRSLGRLRGRRLKAAAAKERASARETDAAAQAG